MVSLLISMYNRCRLMWSRSYYQLHNVTKISINQITIYNQFYFMQINLCHFYNNVTAVSVSPFLKVVQLKITNITMFLFGFVFILQMQREVNGETT